MRTNRVRGLVLLLALVVLAACSEPFGSGYDYGRIEVSAVDQFGDPVFGVTLTLYGKGRHFAFGATNTSGRYVFEFVPFGGFGVEAGPPPGYRFDPGPTRHGFADLEEGDEARIDFVLERLPEELDEEASASLDGVDR